MKGFTFGSAVPARRFVIATAVLALAGCGGGGGGGGGGFPLIPPSTSTPVAPAPIPAAPASAPVAPAPAPEPQAEEHKFIYEGVAPRTTAPDASNFLVPFNTQGAKGMRYFGGADQLSVYVKDSETTYSYELESNPLTLDEFRTQLANRGAAGYQWRGSYFERTSTGTRTTWQIYRKDNGAATTFTYRVVRYSPFTPDGMVAEANVQGADGYYTPNLFSTAANFGVGVYEKDQKSNSTYAYEATELPDLKNDTFLATANERGARGFRLIDASSTGPNGPQFVFVKDTSQNASLSYYSLPTPVGSAQQVEQANAEGAKGGAPLRSSVVHFASSDMPSNAYFFTSKNCRGLLCKPAQNRSDF